MLLLACCCCHVLGVVLGFEIKIKVKQCSNFPSPNATKLFVRSPGIQPYPCCSKEVVSDSP